MGTTTIFNNVSINADKIIVMRRIRSTFTRGYWRAAAQLIMSLSNDDVSRYVSVSADTTASGEDIYEGAAIDIYEVEERSSEWIIRDSIRRVRKAIVRRYEDDRLNNARRYCSLPYDTGSPRQWVVICALKGDSGFPQEYAVRNRINDEHRIVSLEMMGNLY